MQLLVAAHSKIPAGKRKLSQAKTALRKKTASTLNFEENILTIESQMMIKKSKEKLLNLID